jgi:SAM-dependent methyltransferase
VREAPPELARLQDDWHRLGKADPYWAALSLPEKRGGKWSASEFFRTGEEEIARVLERARELGLQVDPRRALDFGCGAGRLAQAMARRFDQVDGVDIAPSMVALARRHNRHRKTCRYHLNASTDLRAFGDAAFTFVYTMLVLQHLPPELAKSYLREFVRVLAPGGLLVFQLPSHRAPAEPPAGAPRTASAGPLPPGAFRAGLSAHQPPTVAPAAGSVLLAVRVLNRGDAVWPCLPRADGRYQVNVAGHWLYPDGSTHHEHDARCPLPFDAAPGDAVEVLLDVPVPPHNGDYVLELDVVQEEVTWFAQAGSEAERLEIRVEGGAGPLPSRVLPAAPAAPPGRATTRFLQRRPRLRRALEAVGLAAVYRAARAAAEGARAWTRAAAAPRPAPRMEMNCVARSEVEALMQSLGARVVDVQTELLPGGFQSCRYWVTS